MAALLWPTAGVLALALLAVLSIAAPAWWLGAVVPVQLYNDFKKEVMGRLEKHGLSKTFVGLCLNNPPKV